MVAFTLSFAVALAGFAGTIWYGKRRRPVGAPLSWGQAMGAAVFAFALLFWCYGVVPHQWLNWAESQLGWRADKPIVGPELFFTEDEGVLEYLLPFSMNYENISHIIAVAIYGLFLTLHVAIWAIWQDRAKVKPPAIATSEYGRPLVKQG